MPRLFVTSGDGESACDLLEKGNGSYEVALSGKKFSVKVIEKGDGFFVAIVNGRPLKFRLKEEDDAFEFLRGGRRKQVKVTFIPLRQMRLGRRGEAGKVHVVKSPMPGRIVKVFVREGDEVEKNAVLLTLEAMKMENEIRAPASGKVKSLHVKENDRVEGKVDLVEIEAK